MSKATAQSVCAVAFQYKGKDEQMKIALLGFGTVGSGVYNILKKM